MHDQESAFWDDRHERLSVSLPSIPSPSALLLWCRAKD